MRFVSKIKKKKNFFSGLVKLIGCYLTRLRNLIDDTLRKTLCVCVCMHQAARG